MGLFLFPAWQSDSCQWKPVLFEQRFLQYQAILLAVIFSYIVLRFEQFCRPNKRFQRPLSNSCQSSSDLIALILCGCIHVMSENVTLALCRCHEQFGFIRVAWKFRNLITWFCLGNLSIINAPSNPPTPPPYNVYTPSPIPISVKRFAVVSLVV